MQNPDSEHGAPFKRKLEPSGINADGRGADNLLTFKGRRREFVVRERGLNFSKEDMKTKYRDGSDIKFLLPDDYEELNDMEKHGVMVQVARKIKGLFDELASFGVSIAFSVVVGKNEKKEDTIFILTNFIVGTDLRDIHSPKDVDEPELLKTELAKTFAGLTDYFIDKVSKGETYLDDVAHYFQFVYGKKEGDEKPKLYMTDADPGYLANVYGGRTQGASSPYIYFLRETAKRAKLLGVDISDSKEKLSKFYKTNSDKFTSPRFFLSEREWLESI